MTTGADPEPSRLQRRKARTRAALVGAAQAMLAEGNRTAPILEITRAADVGMGSFYNHFESREQLFRAAVEEALDRFGAILDRLCADIGDPAQVFAQSFRLTGRLHRLNPTLSKALINNGFDLLDSDIGLAPRVRRDIEDAAAAGRFDVRDPELAMRVVAGAALSLGRLLHDHPERDDATDADRVTEDLLRMFGLSPAEAREICRRPLPALDGPADTTGPAR